MEAAFMSLVQHEGGIHVVSQVAQGTDAPADTRLTSKMDIRGVPGQQAARLPDATSTASSRAKESE
jgi:hypothetical protein